MKIGGGRKILDQKMESDLSIWWISEIEKKKILIPLSVIKQRARKYSNFKDQFKASKGWLDKFIKRYQIQEKISEIMKRFEVKDKSQYKLEGKDDKEKEDVEVYQEETESQINVTLFSVFLFFYIIYSNLA